MNVRFKPSPTVPDQPTDGEKWGVSGSATVGPDTSLLLSVYYLYPANFTDVPGDLANSTEVFNCLKLP